MPRRAWLRFLRYAFHLFYNRFAFTYDAVSAIVSLGHWRAWTRTAIPRITGSRVLEVPCGTGNLLLDLIAAGYAPVAVDLSPSMLRIARGKLQGAYKATRLVRASVQALPFQAQAFDSIVMTFPPGFVREPQTWAELNRVLDDRGRLIWVDAARLLPHGWASRLVQGFVSLVEGTPQEGEFIAAAGELFKRSGFEPTFETIRDTASLVIIGTGTKKGGP